MITWIAVMPDIRRCARCKTEWVLDGEAICILCELEQQKNGIQEAWFDSRLTHMDKKFLKSIKIQP